MESICDCHFDHTYKPFVAIHPPVSHPHLLQTTPVLPRRGNRMPGGWRPLSRLEPFWIVEHLMTLRSSSMMNL